MEERVQKLQPQARAEFRYGASRGRGYSHAWKGDNTTSAEIGDLTMHERFIPIDGSSRASSPARPPGPM